MMIPNTVFSIHTHFYTLHVFDDSTQSYLTYLAQLGVLRLVQLRVRSKFLFFHLLYRFFFRTSLGNRNCSTKCIDVHVSWLLPPSGYKTSLRKTYQSRALRWPSRPRGCAVRVQYWALTTALKLGPGCEQHSNCRACGRHSIYSETRSLRPILNIGYQYDLTLRHYSGFQSYGPFFLKIHAKAGLGWDAISPLKLF